MEKILLSHESYEILLKFAQDTCISQEDADQYPSECIEQLSDYELIECHVTGYDTSGDSIFPKFSEYSITELGKGYIAARQNEDETFRSLKSIAESAEEQAKSAKIQADLAIEAAANAQSDAEKARREALFAKIVSVLAVLVAFFEPFLAAYATEIVNTLLQLFSK